ncbi:hypothetical protein GM921_08360 [Pedobacter sp. LMG 31464]|uniref:DUF3592 domain-containing protein n=1 Tax=Pedobacter planticolens TaxID=2679964 RepID=A0A923E100_9SPHI|nr:hypothetical protein [Pedobacter planticolens]MBB2145492.1 hypothetical protein [Pedobacter planticolens]
MYYKTQIGIIITVTIGCLVALFLFFQNKQTDQNSPIKKHTIVSLTYRTNRGSSVQINQNGKNYFIRISFDANKMYKVGSEIGLRYNEKFDYFYIPDGQKRDSGRLIFLGIIFILSVVPWKRITQ